MSDPESICVVLPVYNGGDFLRESVESVLSQTHEDFRLYVCDDASSDRSWDFLRQIDDPRVVLVRNTRNLGLFPTLNRLLELAEEDLVHLWGQDDVMHEDCLDRTVSFFASFPAPNFSFCRLRAIDDRGEVISEPETFDDRLMSIEDHAVGSILAGCHPGNISTVCMRRRAALDVGGFESSMKYVGDFMMWWKLSRCAPVGMIGDCLAEVRYHSGQLSQDLDAAYFKMIEIREPLLGFTLMLPEELHSIAARALRWRAIPNVAVPMFKLARRFDLSGVFRYWRGLRSLGSPLSIVMRCLIVRILSALGLYGRLYQRFVIDEMNRKRQSIARSD